MGLGLQGRGLGDARFFSQIGAKVTVTDLKSKEDLKESLKELKKLPIKFVLGKHRARDFKNCDLVLRNAAVPRNSKYLKLAEANGAKIFMDEALFALYAPVEIIGITGTRGKTTTATLIYQILKKAGKRVFLAGNILGRATLPFLSKVKKGDLLVLELSSWQLQGFAQIKKSPHISLITSIFPDHLNRYRSMQEYINDKKNIFRFQTRGDYLLLNREQKEIRDLKKEVKNSQIIWFSANDLPKDWRLKMMGRHNRLNAAAARKIARILAVKNVFIKKVISSFPGVEYRLQKVAQIKGVTFINDTASTTPEALIAALKSIKAPIILIAGGASKNLAVEKMAQEAVGRAQKIILLEGSGTQEFAKLIERYGGKDKVQGRFKNLEQAVLTAFGKASKGEVVLFSPGFASFGMFVNEFDRGEQYNKLIEEIAYAHSKEKK